MCTKPFTAYDSAEMNPATGKRGITSDKNKSLNGVAKEFPCRQCLECKFQYVKDWTNRNLFENMFHEDSCFVTLTYDEENLPDGGTLIKDHPSKFMKALRQKIYPKKVRFFSASEYGGKFGRPHIHILIYGWLPEDRDPVRNDEGLISYESDQLTEIWGRGRTELSEVNQKTASYCAQYINKKVYGDLAPDHYTTTHPLTGDLIELEPEFCTMSLRPGIGLKYYKTWLEDMYPSDYLVYKGTRIAVPKFFDRHLERDNPEMFQEIKIKRKLEAKKPNRLKEQTPQRREIRNKIQEIKLNRRNKNVAYQ